MSEIFINSNQNPGKLLKEAVVTVSSSTFIRGTQTLFSSFLYHNPDFKGDLVVIGDAQLVNYRSEFDAFPNIKIHEVSPTLRNASLQVGRKNTRLKNKVKQFYSLEAFNLSGYDKVIFIDSDMVCRQSIEPLFESEHELGACYDRAWYLGKQRDYDSFFMIDPQTKEAGQKTLHPSFNSGFLLINRSLIEEKVYEGLIERINTIDWNNTSGVNDQIVINQYFEGHITVLEEKFNYIAERSGFDQNVHQITCKSASLIHFIGHPKPWQFKAILRNLVKTGHLPELWWMWLFAYLRYMYSRIT